ncbi:STAS domain-containing protein [Alkalilimnicola ehrlichii]|uniref:STAS domain-containing protein n=1 Tax=Alkalilimnicola ehrlichii TaxID=351052 RepID=UPI003B9F7004
MSVNAYTARNGKELVLEILGRFDFGLHKPFRRAYRGRAGLDTYRVDLRQAESMDSSALGMLLLLREHASGQGARVVLHHCQEEVDEILRTANFQKLFEIERSPAPRPVKAE